MAHTPPRHAALDRGGAATSGLARAARGARRLRLATFRWAVGGLCAVIGALMCVVPHQFSSPAFATIRAFLPWAGTLYLAGGTALLAVAALAPGRRLALAGHMAAGLVLLSYSAMLASTGTWGGWPIYLVFGLGTILSGVLGEEAGGGTGGDLFAILVGIAAAYSGLLMLVLPGQYQLSIYDLVRPYLRAVGLAFAAGGALVVAVQLRRPRRLALYAAPHTLLAAALFTYMMLVSVPTRGISGIAYYGGFGALLLALPWVEGRLAAVDTLSLRFRLALTLATTAAIPLILTVTVVTERQERVALDRELAVQQTLALTHARQVDGALDEHIRLVRLLASELVAHGPEQATLEGVMASDPELAGCALVGPGGELLLRAGDPAAVAAAAAAAGGGGPLITFAAPLGPQRPGERAACASDVGAMVGELFSGPGASAVYLVDGGGAVIGQSGTLPLSAQVARLAAAGPGAQRYGEPASALLAGYAPVGDSGLGLVVQTPAASALAGVRQGRETAFGLLVLAGALAMAVGFLIARGMAAPLAKLASAVDRFAAGDADAPIPRRSFTEIERLAGAFGQMRERVTAARDAQEQAIEMRDTFFSVAAHELRTPLTSLIGQAQLLQRRLAREAAVTERDLRSVSVIASQAQRLNRLVSSLLDVARLRRGQLTIERQPLDLRDLLVRVVDELQPTLDRHRLVASGLDSPAPALGDPLRLEQVLQNLIGNAVRYSPDGGAVQIDLRVSGGRAAIAVRDEGIGIPPEALGRLFQQFYRAPNADQFQPGGMGIGLYVVQQIVALHGGDVHVESAEGVGSAFTITLPLREGT